MDLLGFGGTKPDGTIVQPLSIGGIRQYSAVLQGSFRFAVFPKKLISFNPMEYVVRRSQSEDYELFAQNGATEQVTPTINKEKFKELICYLEKKKNPAILPIQIAYYTGLRIGEVCGLSWQDIDLEEQYLTVRRSMRYNQTRHKIEIGPTKRRKVRQDGAYEAPSTVSIVCRSAKKKIQGLEDFHFHTLRHTFTSNLLSYGAAPKEVQELLGHSDVSTTMNIYAHASREAKRTSAKLLDSVMGMD